MVNVLHIFIFKVAAQVTRYRHHYLFLTNELFRLCTLNVEIQLFKFNFNIVTQHGLHYTNSLNILRFALQSNPK